MATAKTPKTAKTAQHEDHAQVLREKMIEAQSSNEVAPVATVEVQPSAVKIVPPTETPATETPEENDTMNTTTNTPEQSAEVPDLRTDAEKIGELLDLHSGIVSDIEAMQQKLDALLNRQSEVFGSLAVYRSELDGSKLTDAVAQEKVKAVADALAHKFGPMGAGMVGLFMSGFTFKAPASLDLGPDAGAKLREVLGVGQGAALPPDFSGLAQAIRTHILTTAGPMADSVRPMLDSVFLELKMVKVAPPVAAKTTGQREGKRDTLGRASFVLPGYPDQTGYDGANASVIVKANGTKAVSFGGQTVQRYLDRVRHPSPERAKADLMTMAVQWAQNAGLLP